MSFISVQASLTSGYMSNLCVALNGFLCADVPLRSYSLTLFQLQLTFDYGFSLDN